MATPTLDTPLYRALESQGRRVKWFAERMGIGPWTVSRIEAGVQPAPDGYYGRAAAILGVPVSDIVPETAEAPAA